jgi:Tat protein translocase TatB subunit
MFGTLGGPELFLILVVALIVFGPRKLPEIGKSVGKMMAEFRKASQDFQRTIEEEVEAEKLREATRIDPPAWSAPAPAALPAATPEAAPPSSAGAPETDAGTTPAATPAADASAPDETVSRGSVAAESK